MSRRVATAGVAAVCITALLVGVIAYVIVARDVRRSEDRLLRAAVAHPAVALGPRTTGSELAQLRDARGAVVAETVALSALGQLPPLVPGFADLVLSGHHLRVDTVRVRRRFLLSVAVSDAPARAALRRLRLGVLVGMLSGALLASLALVWITRRALAPVRQTAALADAIVSTGDLSARVPEPPGDDEIARLAGSMNRMLGHLEASDAALRRLVADASHELRSPVTTLRGNLELLTEGRLAGPDRDAALADARAEAERLGQMVEELLTLARADTVARGARVDLLELVSDAIAGTGARLLPVRDAADLTISGDPAALRAMVRNLAENADRYGGGATIGLEVDADQVRLTVADHGPGIPAAERDAVFGRFSRGANAAGLPGSGLGLAIVAATAHSHGGDVRVADTPGGGATFVVRLARGV